MRRTLTLILAAFALAVAALPSLAQAPAPTSLAKESAKEMLTAYRFNRAEGMLATEDRCWREAKASRKAPAVSALGCARLLIAGGVIDQAMQVTEQRGPVAAFAPAIQRTRYMERAAGLGMTPAAAQDVLVKAVNDIPLIIEGLSEAGLR